VILAQTNVHDFAPHSEMGGTLQAGLLALTVLEGFPTARLDTWMRPVRSFEPAAGEVGQADQPPAQGPPPSRH